MKEWFRLIVFVLEHILHNSKPLFDKPKEIQIFVSDGIRRCEIVWNPDDGARFYDGKKFYEV